MAEEVILEAGASSVASRLTTLIARSSEDASLEPLGRSRGVARMTLENVPRPRDLVFKYCVGE